MRVEVICTGDEVLTGKIVNTNFAHISQKLEDVGLSVAWETTVGEELDGNVHIHAGISEEEFVAMRTARDATLSAPKLLYPAIQVNIRAGRLPPPDESGARYLRLPLTLPEAVS